MDFCRMGVGLAILGLVGALTIDNQLTIIKNDCFERLAIGEKLHERDVYETLEVNTIPDCQRKCTLDEEKCRSFSFGIGVKGNATCELSMKVVRETPDLRPIGTKSDPDFDLYIKKLGCKLVIEHHKPVPHHDELPLVVYGLDDDKKPPKTAKPHSAVTDSYSEGSDYKANRPNVIHTTLISVRPDPNRPMHTGLGAGLGYFDNDRPYSSRPHPHRPLEDDEELRPQESYNRPFRPEGGYPRPMEDDRYNGPFRPEGGYHKPMEDDRNKRPFRPQDDYPRPMLEDDRNKRPFRPEGDYSRPMLGDDGYDRPRPIKGYNRPRPMDGYDSPVVGYEGNRPGGDYNRPNYQESNNDRPRPDVGYIRPDDNYDRPLHDSGYVRPKPDNGYANLRPENDYAVARPKPDMGYAIPRPEIEYGKPYDWPYHDDNVIDRPIKPYGAQFGGRPVRPYYNDDNKFDSPYDHYGSARPITHRPYDTNRFDDKRPPFRPNQLNSPYDSGYRPNHGNEIPKPKPVRRPPYENDDFMFHHQKPFDRPFHDDEPYYEKPLLIRPRPRPVIHDDGGGYGAPMKRPSDPQRPRPVDPNNPNVPYYDSIKPVTEATPYNNRQDIQSSNSMDRVDHSGAHRNKSIVTHTIGPHGETITSIITELEKRKCSS